MNTAAGITIQQMAPYVRYVNDVTFGSGYVQQERVIYDHELIFGVSGEAVLCYEGDRYPCGQSDLLYLKPNLPHQLIVEEGKRFRAHCVHFDWIAMEEQYNFSAEQYYLRTDYTPEQMKHAETLSRRPASELIGMNIDVRTTGLPFDLAVALFRDLHQSYCENSLSAQLRQRAALLQILALVLDSRHVTDQRKPRHQKIMRQVMHYMETHYMKPLTASSLASQFGLSPKYFGVLFKANTGLAVHEYLLDIRMRQAKDLLVHTRMPIKQIAQEIGVCDEYYFAKLFKRHERLTPGAYRSMLTAYDS